MQQHNLTRHIKCVCYIVTMTDKVVRRYFYNLNKIEAEQVDRIRHFHIQFSKIQPNTFLTITK